MLLWYTIRTGAVDPIFPRAAPRTLYVSIEGAGTWDPLFEAAFRARWPAQPELTLAFDAPADPGERTAAWGILEVRVDIRYVYDKLYEMLAKHEEEIKAKLSRELSAAIPAFELRSR
ncbi:MAG: hypothetical protein JXR37_23610 [Kiritimatiellae bacterium]|nr:hypothetical protein [Kiritimatiellia bacterium]